MSETFNPYSEWLGLELLQSTPNHYQLLGLSEFEPDAARITAAADARMAQVRTYQTGPRGKYTQKLLNEIAAAKLCLIDPRARAAYDAQLQVQRQRIMPLAPPVAPWPPPTSFAAPLMPGNRAEVADEPEPTDVAEVASRWWLPLGLVLGLVLLVTLITGVIIGKRLGKKPTAEVVQTSPAQDGAQQSPHEETPPAEVDPHLVALEPNGDLYLLPGTAELHGGVQLQGEGNEAGLSNWHEGDAAARWRFVLEKPAIFQVQLVYAAQGTGASQWELTAGSEQAKRRDILINEEGQPTVTDEFYWKVGESGEHELTLRAVELPGDATLTLKSLRLFRQKTGRAR